MTNELYKQFFNTFNIEPIGCNDNKNCTGALDCIQCTNAKYPQITDRILLELICILNNYGCTSFAGNFEQLKKEILANSIMCCDNTEDDNFKHQVRTLFEES